MKFQGKFISNVDELVLWRDGSEENYLALGQLCLVVMNALPHHTLLHGQRFLFTDINRHQHSGIDLGFGPMFDQDMRVAIKIPSHDRQVVEDRDLEIVVAASHVGFSPDLQLYRFLDDKKSKDDFCLSLEWLRSQVLDLITAAVRSPSSIKYLEGLKQQLSTRSFLLREDAVKSLFV